MPSIFKPDRFLLDEDEFELDGLDAPSIPKQAPSPPTMGGPTQEPRWTALDEYSDVLSKRPELKRASGWKGVLQTIGEVALKPEVIHPKYTRQMQDYADAVGQAKSQADIEGQFIRRGIDQAKLESQQRADERRGAAADKQAALAEERINELGRPKPGPQMTEITPAMGQKLNITPDADGKYRIPSNQLPVLRPPTERAVTELEAYIKQAGGDYAKGLKAYEAAQIRRRAAGRTPRGGGDGDSGRKMPAATASNIEGDKMAAMLDASDWADAEIERIKSGVKAPQPAMDTEAKGRPRFATEDEAKAWKAKQVERAQRIYEGKIGAATGNYPAPLAVLPQQTPPAAPPPVGQQGPPPEVVSRMKVGQLTDGPDGSTWRKKADGTVERVK